MKKIIKLILLLLVVVGISSFSEVQTVDASTTYVEPESEFRAVWMSHFIGSVANYSSETSYKNELTRTLNILESYNINAIIFHIRTHNNAMYDSDLNPIATWWSNVNFDEFDPLEWLIEECHQRGIEFHAWMNPYRVNSSFCAEDYPEGNPANDPSKLLNGIIDPGIPSNREFIIRTCMEVIEKYDVDAIHFDDYFYASNIDDDDTYNTYKGNSTTTNKSDWRREQVDLFIEGLHNEITNYNLKNNRYVQLGISPTGIYRNGNGVVTYDSNGHAITTGSDTRGQEHYASYLFCNTLKWCNEGWIDYILPQSYWAQNHAVASYLKVMSWWDKVVKNLDVNLYSGIGVYMANSSGTYGWATNDDELLEQLTYITTLENVKGASMYSYNYLRDAYNGSTSQSAKTLADLGTNCWTRRVVVPEITSFEQINLGQVQGFEIEGNVLTWDKLADAKFYAIYRSSSNLDFSSDELIDVVGGTAVNGKYTYVDDAEGYFEYGIKAISYSNTLGEETRINTPKQGSFNILTDNSQTSSNNGTEVNENGGSSNGKTIQIGFTRCAFLSSEAPSASRLEYNWSSSNTSVATVSEYGTIRAIASGEVIITAELKSDPSKFGQIKIVVYTSKTELSQSYKVTFKDYNGEVLKEESVNFSESATAPEYPNTPGIEFIGWNKDFSCITKDTVITANCKIQYFEVIFKDFDGDTVKTEIVRYGDNATAPTASEITGYTFTGWSEEITNVTSDLVVRAEYSKKSYTITFLDYDDTVITTVDVLYQENAVLPASPEREGYEFRYWSGIYNNVVKDETVKAIYRIKSFQVTFVTEDGDIISTQNVNYDYDATAPSTVDIEDFARWDEDFTNVKEDLVVTAITYKYQVVFLNYDDSEIHSYKACENDEIIFPSDPVRAGYIFSGWDTDKETVTEDLIIKALFSNLTNTVTFVDYDDTVIKTVEVAYGENATCEEPTRNGYTFVGWDVSVEKVTEDITAKALYTKNTESSSCSFALSVTNMLFALSVAFFVLSRRKK